MKSVFHIRRLWLAGSLLLIMVVAVQGDENISTFQRYPGLTSVYNIRDFGNYEARDGRIVRPGVLYRSGRLSNLNTQDLAYIEALDPGRIFDLRTTREVQANPSSLSQQLLATRIHLPVGDRKNLDTHSRNLLTALYSQADLEQVDSSLVAGQMLVAYWVSPRRSATPSTIIV